MTASIRRRSRATPPAKLEKLLADPGIIRHKGKIDASVSNAKAYLALVEREGSFAKFPVELRRRQAEEEPSEEP